tara:strand:+ start:23760 stop:25796 length:2037 start_codon:yes stop_codon:yes gene_type:complete
MKRDNTPWQAAPAADIRWHNDCQPMSREFGDFYYSSDDGLLETRHTFIKGNRLPERWNHHPRSTFVIAETGFGTGLNFLATWQLWRQRLAVQADLPLLHYVAIEKYPLHRDDLARALSRWTELEPLCAELLGHYPGLLPGQHRLLLDEGRVILDLWWEDIADALPDLASREEPLFDAWYLDGFAPACNPQMWQRDALEAMAGSSHCGASFATFTAATQVRRHLEACGFTVHKTAGYGLKREHLYGQLNNTVHNITQPQITPWDLPAEAPTKPATALVIGAGLAGCSTAAALARRGINVTLLERDTIASGGSGNEQGVLYTRVSHKHSALTDFALQSFGFASQHYRRMLTQGALRDGVDGALCGSFQQSEKRDELAALEHCLRAVPELAQVLDKDQANSLLGITQPHSGIWFSSSGWFNPPAVCHALLQGAESNSGSIQCSTQTGDVSLSFDNGQWQASHAGTVVAQADCAVIASAFDSRAFAATQWLPLQAIRGQTTLLPTNEAQSDLRAVICHSGYIAPARQGKHCIGATFDVNDNDNRLREQDHRYNLDALARAVPGWSSQLDSVNSATLKGRVGHRCASPDYLPLVGPAPDVPRFLHDYAALRKNAKQIIHHKGHYMPGLYINTGHGSRGLTSTPLAAELLASLICAEPPPLSRELQRALAPSRFIVRQLMRNKL